MSSQVEELKAYFSAFDGSENAWENRVQQAVEKLYHPDLVVVTGEGEKSREEMVNFVKTFALQGGKAQDMKFVDLGNEKIRYSGSLIHGDGSVSKIDSLGSFKDGMLIRVEPADPTVYSDMMKKEKS